MDISYLDMKFNAVMSSVNHTGSCFNCQFSAYLVVEIDLKSLIIYVLTLGLMCYSQFYSVANTRWLHE